MTAADRMIAATRLRSVRRSVGTRFHVGRVAAGNHRRTAVEFDEVGQVAVGTILIDCHDTRLDFDQRIREVEHCVGSFVTQIVVVGLGEILLEHCWGLV